MRRFNVTVNGKTYQVEVDEVGLSQPSVSYVPVQPVQPVQQSPVVQQEKPVSGEQMSAPMPGNILDIKVSEGQRVKAGDVLLILEAMKMENEITAPKDGVIVKIHTSKGTTVNAGDALITIG
jgi:glutaconyl-CoA/methylmalonyl-CoA decarboxylase subunit gamma